VTGESRRPRVLCVDDDPVMLNIITRMIGADYEVLGAPNGEQALGLIESSAPIDVVVSDHRMGGLSGAQFLQVVRDKHPLTVRILLTGERDLAAVVAAMNQAGLFRFLLKPTSRAVLLDTLGAAVIQHQLQVAERQLLQETLIGAMRALGDVLAVANPIAFGRVSRIQELALAVSKQMNLLEQWPLEFASLASQLGHIALPEKTLRRLYAGESLTPVENDQVWKSAKVAERILARIPRLGPVVEILSQLASDENQQVQTPESVAAKILRVVSIYEVFERTSASRNTAVQRLRAQADRLDTKVLTALTDALGLDLSPDEAIEVPIGRVRVEMIVAEDVLTGNGALLVPKGYRISENFLARLANFNPNLLPKAIRVRKDV
jgi:response regulator RpfG family c-di-GMP phosphodiesterase